MTSSGSPGLHFFCDWDPLDIAHAFAVSVPFAIFHCGHGYLHVRAIANTAWPCSIIATGWTVPYAACFFILLVFGATDVQSSRARSARQAASAELGGRGVVQESVCKETNVEGAGARLDFLLLVVRFRVSERAVCERSVGRPLGGAAGADVAWSMMPSSSASS